ncbi:DUF333 domain-containing protein [Halochromatium roseum]|uniref:putative hemolysin n=1 Tax=Halochromatium roseum TaxID=391920 RepID=UPI0019144D71|nr:DUF333 domain-containing protein [Halochromatium roseum]MBK5938909.1 hypothetical protein [Halochromatium roseum]
MPLFHARQGRLTLLATLGLIGSTLVFAADPPKAPPKQGLANPASVNCIKLGGTLDIRTRPHAGQYGVCVFEDNRQCEEWALLRGDCPAGGIKVTGYDSDAEIYCAITGGEVDMQTGSCQSAEGVRCGLEAFFAGRCPASR